MREVVKICEFPVTSISSLWATGMAESRQNLNKTQELSDLP
jgi:hypothetical protein